MSETTDTAPWPVSPAAVPSPAAVAASVLPPVILGARDWVRLAEGFYFVFGGLLVTLAALLEALIAPAPRFFQAFTSGTAAIATLIGAWRLTQARVSAAWRWRARLLLAVTAAMAYWWPFFQMWLGLPGRLHLLVNALGYVTVCFLCPAVLNYAIAALAEACGLRPVVTQARAYAVAGLLFLVLPVLAVAPALVIVTRQGLDPILMVRAILGRAPELLLAVLLIPVSLTLSLVWAVKDLALRRLSSLDESKQST